MGNLKFSNNAESALSAGINAGATSFAVATGEGNAFPSIVSGQYFYVRIGTDSINEVVKVTGRSSDTFSCDPTVSPWISGDTVALTVNAEAMDELAQKSEIRELIGSPRTYYVSSTGNDSNDGLSIGNPFLTIQKAVDTVCSIDMGLHQVTVQIVDGSYSSGAFLKPFVGTLPPVIVGNLTTPSNVIVTSIASNVFYASAPCVWLLESMQLGTTTSGNCIDATGGCEIKYSNIVFGTCAGYHISSRFGARVNCYGSYSITGGSNGHWYASYGQVKVLDKTITLVGNPSITTFAQSYLGSSIECNGIFFVGTAVGKRYAAVNAIIYTASAGANYLPGTVSGTVTTGWYL